MKTLSEPDYWPDGWIEIGTRVTLDTGYDDTFGETMEETSNSPVSYKPFRKVVRVRWADGSESIEDIDDIY